MKHKKQNLKQIVKKVLEEYPETRESDTDLILRIWEIQGLKLNSSQIGKIHYCYSMESVTREKRRVLQEGLEIASHEKDRGYIVVRKV